MAGPFWATQAAQKAGIEGPIRKVLWKCYQHGRQIIQGVFQKGEVASAKPNKDPLRAQFEAPRVEIKGPVILPKGSQTPIKPNSLGGLVYRANIQTFAGQLRKKAALQFLGGNLSRNAKHTPIFAFVSLALSAGQSFEKKDDPTENVFAQIREMFKPGTANGPAEETGNDLPCEIGLDDLEFGKMINKGCNAAVYEARLKPAEGESEISWAELRTPGEVQGENYVIETSLNTDQEQGETTLLDIDSDEMEFDDGDISIISHVETEGTWLDVAEDGDMAVFSIAPVLTEAESNSLADGDLDHDPDNDYDLAVKMMFNYDVESNSEAILRAMEKETVPARSRFKQGTSPMWENGSHVKKKRDLPPHPNIVDMRSVFVGCVPLLEDALTQFPDALPTLYNPEGFGRNQTMFLVMKKYSHTLREYLSREDHLSLRSSLLLYVQLLEGVVHMVQHGIAHRDLKSDNILVEAGGDNSPHLVISDFGCCLAEEGGLKMPYLSEEMFRGGNRALMAPEIAGAVPGNSSTLEYSQSDVWAAGALGYEIFGGGNPFYRGQTNQRLDSLTYTEDQLPTLDGEIPEPIRQLVKSLLNRDPKQRPIPEVAANLIHILLWASDDWLSEKRPSREDVTQWLLTMAAKVLCQEKVRVGRSRCFRQPSKVAGTWPAVEYQLVKTFLSRVRVDEIMEAVEML